MSEVIGSIGGAVIGVVVVVAGTGIGAVEFVGTGSSRDQYAVNVVVVAVWLGLCREGILDKRIEINGTIICFYTKKGAISEISNVYHRIFNFSL
jgi:hypothetical protein